MEPTRKASAGESENVNADGDPAPESGTDSESSDFDREYTCDVCDKSFSGMKPLQQHQISGKHLKALRKQKLKRDLEKEEQDDESSDEDFSLDQNKIFAECDVCCKEFNGPESYHLHIHSKRHKRKVANSKILEKSKEDGKINVEKLKQIMKADSSALETSARSDSSESEVFECKDCEKVFSGLEPFRDHMTSKIHRKILEQKEMVQKLILDSGNTIEIIDGVLVCKLCRKSFSGPESAATHLKSKGHLEWLEFKKWKKERKNKVKQDSESDIFVEASTSAEATGNSFLSDKDREKVTVRNDSEKTNENKDNENQTFQARASYKKYKEIMNDSKSVE